MADETGWDEELYNEEFANRLDDIYEEGCIDCGCEYCQYCQEKETLFNDKDFDGMIEQCVGTMKVKGQDYTLGNVDRLYNFKKVAEFTGLTPQQVWSVYFAKHIFAIFNYVKSGGQCESEAIDGRIMDAINYLLFLHKMETEKKNK